ncbi:hypothetical protein G8A07_08315 [Roseateles sp. DAIF2]|uniref:ribbon-helix-helix domain-containing protein n=1 Tax=Roseateles sp. DAIF2 TaxID=2714952 RepID=UPI0018A290A9|nr:CopG family transcriptional regulator [Roseateles sp. DAIF2]QPF72932.1 hypothetical protein G8A07_08315 [Roseateles sp. DAIF2]
MSAPAPATPKNPTLAGELGEALLGHWPSSTLILLLTLLACLPIGVPPAGLSGLTSAVFQVAGTMVALALPAAQLAHTMVGDVEKQLLHLLDEEAARLATPARRIEVSRRMTSELQRHMYPAWRSAAYALLSLLLSGLALLLAPTGWHWQPCGPVISFDALLPGAALACLLCAALWLYPTVHYLFRLRSLDELQRTLDELLADETAAPAPN